MPLPLMSPSAMADAGLRAGCAVGLVGVAEDEEVVVVAGDGARRAADAVQLQRGQIVLLLRKEVGLDLLRDGELALQALFFLLLKQQAFERAGHAVEGACEFAELVGGLVARDRDAVHEVAAVDALGGGVEGRDRASDVAAEAEGHNQCQGLDQREDDAESDEAVADRSR